jgi:hypothetical protein
MLPELLTSVEAGGDAPVVIKRGRPVSGSPGFAEQFRMVTRSSRVRPSSRMLKRSASGVLASLRGSTVRRR